MFLLTIEVLYKNVVIKENCDCNELNTILKETSFILVRNYKKYNDRFSGSISMGISNKIPIICNNILSINTPSINFSNNYSELIEKINNFNKISYDLEIKKIITFIHVIKIKNKQYFKELFD